MDIGAALMHPMPLLLRAVTMQSISMIYRIGLPDESDWRLEDGGLIPPLLFRASYTLSNSLQEVNKALSIAVLQQQRRVVHGVVAVREAGVNSDLAL